MGATNDTLDELAANMRELVAQGRRREMLEWQRGTVGIVDDYSGHLIAALILIVVIMAVRARKAPDAPARRGPRDDDTPEGVRL